ncbi:MAG: hypothetical protein NVSMB2_07910 [Chloroflexota bacterium]
MRRLMAVVAVLVWVAMPSLARADPLDDGVRRVALQLQCPVCEGQSAADSPSGLAADMRSVIRTRLMAGESDQQVLDEFVASYGDSILSEPPKRGVSLGVWLGPLLGVVLGGGALVALLRAWHRTQRGGVAAGGPETLEPDVLEEFSRFRQEVGI